MADQTCLQQQPALLTPLSLPAAASSPLPPADHPLKQPVAEPLVAAEETSSQSSASPAVNHVTDQPLVSSDVPAPAAACVQLPSPATQSLASASSDGAAPRIAASAAAVPVAAVTSSSNAITTLTPLPSPAVQAAVTTTASPVPGSTAKRVILTAHPQSVLNAPIRTSSPNRSSNIISAGSKVLQMVQPAAASLPNGNVCSPAASANSPSVITSPAVPLMARTANIASAIQSPSSHQIVIQSSGPAPATNSSPSAAKPVLTTPATGGLISNHQLLANSNNSAGNKLQSPAPGQQHQTVIITTPDGQQKVMAIQQSSIVNQSAGGGGTATAVRPVAGNISNNNNVISSGTATVLLGKPIQSQANLQTQVTGQMHQQQQPQQQQQQVLVSNPQMQPQMFQIRTPSGQIQQMQLNPQQQQGLQRQLAPRPNLIALNNGQVRIPQNLRPGQQQVHQPGTINFRPGMSGQFLIRTEHGLQLINIAPQPGLQQGQPGPIRFNVPAQQMTQVRPNVVNISTQPQIRTGQLPQQQQQQLQQQQQQQQPQMPVNQQLTIQTAQANSQAASSQSQMSPNTAKRKCKNFLSTLIRLATDQPEHVAQNVRKLIQGLIDGNIIPEDFTNQLQRELNSSPQPCLIPFLKKSLPHLKQSLMLGELTIDGVNPPPRGTLNQPQLPLQFQRPPAGIRFLTTASPLNFPPGSLVQTQQPQSQPQLQQQQVQRPQGPPSQMQAGPSSLPPPPAPVTPAPKSKSKAKPRASTTPKDKDKKISTSLREDDDINDVAAMGGVNLAEENQRMAAAANEVGTQIRSCKDENFFLTNILTNKINRIASKFSLEDPALDVISLISHAAQERIKTLVERLGVIAEHRLEVFKVDPKYEVAQDVRSQVKFLEELDKMEKRRHEEQEREMLLKAAKSRSKLEDPEQLKLKQKAKEMQRAEMEEARQREANETALLAIGPRKKLKLDSTPSSTSTSPSAPTAASGASASAANPASGSAGSATGNNFTPFNNSQPSNHYNSIFSTPFSSTKGPMRRMTKRVNMKDLLFLMEQDRGTAKSPFLYKSYTK